MKKIDILNFITDFRKAPNRIMKYKELISHLGTQHEAAITAMLDELERGRVVKQTELEGERAYQVIAR
jgi:hypothetical protein